MGNAAISETPRAEIERLTAELAVAHQRLDAAFNATPRGDIAKDARLIPYLAEAQNVLSIVRRIQKLKGIS